MYGKFKNQLENIFGIDNLFSNEEKEIEDEIHQLEKDLESKRKSLELQQNQVDTLNDSIQYYKDKFAKVNIDFKAKIAEVDVAKYLVEKEKASHNYSESSQATLNYNQFVFQKNILKKEIGNQHIIIADAKRGDIGNSAAHYANAFFKHFNCDAITVNPYMGEETITPFSTDSTKGVYVLCVTSNSSAGYIQNDTFKNVINLTNDMNENKNIGLV